MRVMLSIFTSLIVLGVAPAAGAQQKKAEPRKQEKKEVTGDRCVSDDGKIECRIFRRADMDSVMKKRAALGLQLTATGSLRDTIGVFVARVVPKGPAENAGIVEGDRIVSINGVDLRVNAADAEDSYASELPSRRLTREVRKLAPGSNVNLRVSSGGRFRDVQVTAGSAFDLRGSSGSFGFLLDGMPGGSFSRMMPSGTFEFHDFPRMNLQAFPKIRMESIPKVRIRSFPDVDGDWSPELDMLLDKKKEKEKSIRM